MKIISGSSNLSFAQNIVKHLQTSLVPVEISYFNNGEKRVFIKDSVRGENVAIVQSFSQPCDEYIMEFLLLNDALQRAGARHINAIIPWMGYSLQDKVFREGEPIAAKVVADLISHAYVKRVFLLDLHNSSTPGFFSIPTQHLSALQLFVEYAQKTFTIQPDTFVVASPDFGGLKRGHTFAEKLGLDLINIDKHRNLRTGEVTSVGMSGEVEGKHVLLFDDLINSGSTVVSSSDILKKNGAKSVHFFATHGIFANNGCERIQNSSIDSVVVTNSIQQTMGDKFHIIDVSKLFADAVSAWG